MYTELDMYVALRTARNTDLTTSQIMRRLDQAKADDVFADLVWGNLTEAKLDGVAVYFMVEYCGDGHEEAA